MSEDKKDVVEVLEEVVETTDQNEVGEEVTALKGEEDKIVKDTENLPIAESLKDVIAHQAEGTPIKITDPNVLASIVDQSLKSGAFDHLIIVSALVNVIEEAVVTGEGLQIKYRDDATYFSPDAPEGTVH